MHSILSLTTTTPNSRGILTLEVILIKASFKTYDFCRDVLSYRFYGLKPFLHSYFFGYRSLKLTAIFTDIYLSCVTIKMKFPFKSWKKGKEKNHFIEVSTQYVYIYIYCATQIMSFEIKNKNILAASTCEYSQIYTLLLYGDV